MIMKKGIKSSLFVVLLVIAFVMTSCSTSTTNKPKATTAPATSSAANETKTTSNGSTDDVIRIGLVTSLTGSLAFASNEVKNAIELAVEKKPELLGKKVVFEAADASDATQAMSEFERLYAKGVRYFMGGYGTFMDIAIQKVVDERGCIYISASGWADQLTETKIKNYFHFTPRVAVFGERLATYMAEYAEKYLGKKASDLKVAVIWNTNVEYVANSALKALETANINVAVKEGYPVDRKDFTALIAKLQSANIDVLVPCQQSPDGIPFRKKMVEMGYNPPMLMAMGLIYDQPDFGKLGADIVDGCMALSYTHPSINRAAAPGLDEFSETYNKKHGWYPLTHATQTYAGTLFLLDMIEKAGTAEVAKVQQTIANCDIEKGKYPNYWGVKFDEYHRNISAGDPLVIGQWQNGELIAVGTDEIKTADAIIPWDKTKLKK